MLRIKILVSIHSLNNFTPSPLATEIESGHVLLRGGFLYYSKRGEGYRKSLAFKKSAL